MKAIIIGASLSGKTTLINYLRTRIDVLVSEMDEELTKMNHGHFPADEIEKRNLSRKVINNILKKDSILFFTNTNYFSETDLKKAKNNGFLIIQLNLSLEELQKRNNNRVQNESYQDMTQWLGGMVEYQKEINEKGLVDFKINMNQKVEDIAHSLLRNQK